MSNVLWLKTVIRIAILWLGLCAPAIAQTTAHNGLLVEPNWQFESQKLLLQGEWQVIWGKLVAPSEFDVEYRGALFTLPNNWNDAGNAVDDGVKNAAYGVATFRLNLNLSTYEKSLSFHLISPNSSWKLFQNGSLIGGNGVVSQIEEQVKANYISRVMPAKNGISQLILQVANFTHAYGGAEYPIEVWDAAQLKLRLDLMSVLFSLALGILFSIGLIHIVFYLADRKHQQQGPVHLWFGLLCFILVIRISGIVPFFYIYTANSAYWSTLILPYFTLYAAPAVYLLFFRSIFRPFFPPKLTQYIIWLSSVMMVATLFTTEKIYTQTKFFAIGLNLFVILYSLYFTYIALKAKERGAIAVLITNFLFLLTSLNDAQIYSLNGNGFDMTPFGFVVLGLGYSYALLTRLQQTFDQAHDTSLELEKLNIGLEEQVVDRTRAFKNAAAKAKNSAHEKAQFIAAASHDLRQPLHALALFNLALKRHVSDDKTKSLVNKQGDAIENLGVLLHDTLDASKMDSVRRVPQFSEVNVAELFDKLSNGFKIRSENQNINLKFDNQLNGIICDAAMLQRILSNLIDNGIKAAQTQVDITASSVGENWVFQVSDDGGGIDKQDVNNIFNSYTSMDESQTDETGGYGLGLYVVKEFCKSIDAKVEVKPNLPKGTCFEITIKTKLLKINPNTNSSIEPVYAEKFEKFDLTILSIDDEAEILNAMHETLTSWGCTSLIAANIETAENTLSICVAKNKLPDLLLVDYHLHGKNGVDIVQQLRQKFNQEIPAIIISGATQQFILDHISNAGLDFLAKPITASSLANFLRKTEQSAKIKQALP